MNGYARLSDIKADIAGVTGTSLDSALVSLRDEVSREFDRATRRFFYSRTETRYLSGESCRELWVKDLVSVTTLKISADADQPTTFDYTLVAGTDYTLWPRNAAAENKPYRKIILNPNGQFSAFSAGIDNIELVGVFGWPVQSDQVVVSATAVTGTLSSTTDLTLTCSVSVAAVIDVGDTLIIESEQVEVTAVSTVTVTVVRAINGTTAATHTDAALYIRRYPLDLENAVKERTVGRRWDAQSGYDAGITLTGDSMGAANRTTGRAIYSRWRDACAGYADPAAVL